MSAFVIDTDAMDRAVQAICAAGRHGMIVGKFDGIDTSASDAGTLIGRRLFTLNIEAVMQRYPDTQDNPDDMPGTVGCAEYPTTYRFNGRPGARLPAGRLVAGFKALQGLRYQCSEGDVKGTPLYRELTDVIGTIAADIVERLPAYEAAPWA
jgi:hypothetical protein